MPKPNIEDRMIFAAIERIYEYTESSLKQLETVDGLLESSGYTGERDELAKKLGELLECMEVCLPGMEMAAKGEI